MGAASRRWRWRCVLIAAKTGAWLITDSVSMLSSLVNSALDLVSSLITFVAIRQALAPADARPPLRPRQGRGAGRRGPGRLHRRLGGRPAADRGRPLPASPCRCRRRLVGALVSALAIVLTLGLIAVPEPCRAPHRLARDQRRPRALHHRLRHQHRGRASAICLSSRLDRAADRPRRGGRRGALSGARRLADRAQRDRRADGSRAADAGPPAHPRHRARAIPACATCTTCAPARPG